MKYPIKLILSLLLCFCIAAAADAAPAKKKANRTTARRVQRPQAKAVKRSPARAAAKTPAKTAGTVSAYRRDPYVGALAIDAETGRVLFTDGADRKAYPASVTKLMTALLVLEDVASGKYPLTHQVGATALSNLMEPSIIGFRDEKTGKQVAWSVDTLLYALMIRSANDAAVALAENSAGTHAAFVGRMNDRARELGMNSTGYFNANGLPPNSAKRYPWKQFNYTTCSDQAKLARHLIKHHPEIIKYTSCKTWRMPNGQNIINHNNVMRMDKYKIYNADGTEAVDGLKTGYINAGGSSVVLSGKRGRRRAIVVVLGSASAQLRDTNARAFMADALLAL